MKALILVGASFGMAACAHVGTHRGVVSQLSDNEARVRMQGGQAAVGDRVVFVKETCDPFRQDDVPFDFYCETQRMGEGTVREIESEHLIVAIDEPLDSGEGLQAKRQDTYEAVLPES